MIKYHPDARFLTDYAAGSLPVSQALCVATHLHYCVGCRTKIRELNELGAELFMQLPSASVAPSEYDRLLARIHSATPQPASDESTRNSVSILPRAVSKLANGNLEKLPLRMTVISSASWRWLGTAPPALM